MLLGAEAWARAAIPAFAIATPLRCSFVAPQLPGDTGLPRVIEPLSPAVSPELSAAQAKREDAPARVSSAAPRPRRPAAPSEAIELPAEVVVRAVGGGQPAFLRCGARAPRLDAAQVATQIANKVRVRLEVDASGKVSSVQTDSESPVLARCMGVVARQLAFPAPGRPAVVDLPLIFR